MKSTKDNTEDAIIKLNSALAAALRTHLEGGIEIRFDLPQLDMQVASPTVSVFLYQLTEDLELREGEPRQYLKGEGKYKVANVYLRCSFLITYWDPSDGGESDQGPDSQQMKVISRITGALINNRELPDGGSLFSRLMPSEHLNSLGNFWQALGNRPRLCLTYDADIRVPLNGPNQGVERVDVITVETQYGLKQPRKPRTPK